MQPNLAPTPALTQARSQTRRLRFYGVLALEAVVFLAVTIPLFRKIQVHAGEEDARVALRLIAGAIAELPDGPPENLADWIQGQRILKHRLGDLRIEDSDLRYHGYRIEWISDPPGSMGRR
ncbi:MAG: hypothetical protein KDB61_06735, partial [Planctomycetes bacterium]|nr:hypothetical protein [Planctomycetota bacterium]